MRRLIPASALLVLSLLMGAAIAVVTHPAAGAAEQAGGQKQFELVETGADGTVASVYVDVADFPVVRHAARLLTEDVERVTGRKPALVTDASKLSGRAVIVGTIGRSPVIDRLIADGKLDVEGIRGKWESHVIQRVPQPMAGVDEALVIAGSDRRGTAYGVFTISEEIGVSPWYFWADVHPDPKDALAIEAGTRKQGPPDVKYRGIFINDEDWGLEPWSRLTYDPELGDIGPKTYERVFELLLRLKGNYLWPGMHNCTIEFGSVPGNVEKADEWAIVMGAAHCEPLNRNNVWWHQDGEGEWRYDTNRANMIAYWEEWAQKRGPYEAVWTVGMRGIHDAGMKGPATVEGQVELLEQAIADQRDLLKKHVHEDVEQVPQVFTPYKEALTHYQAGLKLPDDVTILWAEDNYGYIRQLSDPQEQQRAGGSGVYYHISYLGWPRPYLWLNTTPPALMWSEMTKAYENGAQRIWIVNVGDIKPGEIGTEFWMDLAWEVDRWGPGDAQDAFLRDWAERDFGREQAQQTAAVMDDYYQLGFQRKPELMDANVFHVAHYDEWERRIAASRDLRRRADELYGEVPPHKRDAFYQLVLYPVRILSLTDEAFYGAEMSRLYAMQGRSSAEALAAQSTDAVKQMEAETRYYNEELAGGKWRHMMTVKGIGGNWNVQWPAGGTYEPMSEPAMGVVVEGSGVPLLPRQLHDRLAGTVVELTSGEAQIEAPMVRKRDGGGTEFIVVPNRQPAKSGNTLTAGEGAKAVFEFEVPRDGRYNLFALINAPNPEDDSWFFKLDSGEWMTWNDVSARGGWEWRQQGSYDLKAGRHTLTIANREDGAMLAKIRLTPRESALNLEEIFADTGPANLLPTFNRQVPRAHDIEIYNLGAKAFDFTATAGAPWIQLSTAGGRVDGTARVEVSINWSKVPQGERAEGTVKISGPASEQTVRVHAVTPPSEGTPDAPRFAEVDGHVSIEAEHFSRRRAGSEKAQWHVVGDLGRTGDAISVLPTTMPSRADVAEIVKGAPMVEYDLSLYSSPEKVRATVYCVPTHRLYEGRGLRYAIAIGDEPPQIVDFYESGGHGGEQSPRWRDNVSRNAAINVTTHKLTGEAGGNGKRTLRIWAVDPGVVIDKIVLDTGALKESYLGPPETRIGHE